MEGGLGREGSLYVCGVCFGVKNSKVVFISLDYYITWKKYLDLTISSKQSNWVRSMLRSALLVIGHVLTVDAIGLVQKMVGGIQKHRLLLQTLPSLSPSFALFSLPPPNPIPLPFLRLPRRLINIDKVLKRKAFREGIPRQNLPGGRRLSTLANINQRTHQLGN